jgi:CIC family chloride channel protein
VYDLPFLAILGDPGRSAGGLFGRGIFASLTFFRQFKRLGLPGRIGLAGLVTGMVGVFLPIAAEDNSGLQEFLVTGSVGWQLVAIAFVTKFVLTLLAYGLGPPGGFLPLPWCWGRPWAVW